MILPSEDELRRQTAANANSAKTNCAKTEYQAKASSPARMNCEDELREDEAPGADELPIKDGFLSCRNLSLPGKELSARIGCCRKCDELPGEDDPGRSACNMNFAPSSTTSTNPTTFFVDECATAVVWKGLSACQD